MTKPQIPINIQSPNRNDYNEIQECGPALRRTSALARRGGYQRTSLRLDSRAPTEKIRPIFDQMISNPLRSGSAGNAAAGKV
jgi:hypothetical protein